VRHNRRQDGRGGKEGKNRVRFRIGQSTETLLKTVTTRADTHGLPRRGDQGVRNQLLVEGIWDCTARQRAVTFNLGRSQGVDGTGDKSSQPIVYNLLQTATRRRDHIGNKDVRSVHR
jgi:hypothetical protein